MPGSSVNADLRAPDGRWIHVEVVSIVDGDDAITATFELDVHDWHRAERAGLFHTDRSAGMERPFEPDRPVSVEVVLGPDHGIDGADALRARLAAGGDDDLLRTESWWAVSATQAIELPDDLRDEGDLREGVWYGLPPWAGGPPVDLMPSWRQGLAGRSEEPLLDLVTAVFDDEGWVVERPDPEATLLQAPVEDDAGRFELWVRTAEEQDLVTVFAVFGELPPEDRVLEVVELAARMNAVVAVGSYEADPDTGAMRFKTGIDVEGDRLSRALARQLIGTAIVAGHRALPLLAAVAGGGSSAREAAELL